MSALSANNSAIALLLSAIALLFCQQILHLRLVCYRSAIGLHKMSPYLQSLCYRSAINESGQQDVSICDGSAIALLSLCFISHDVSSGQQRSATVSIRCQQMVSIDYTRRNKCQHLL
jgi:hypothetical protein